MLVQNVDFDDEAKSNKDLISSSSSASAKLQGKTSDQINCQLDDS